MPTNKKRPVVTQVNVYDSDVWGSCGEGIRAAFYTDDTMMPVSGVHLVGLDQSWAGADEWYNLDELPADVRAAIEAEGIPL
jgi:hypothetical protein